MVFSYSTISSFFLQPAVGGHVCDYGICQNGSHIDVLRYVNEGETGTLSSSVSGSTPLHTWGYFGHTSHGYAVIDLSGLVVNTSQRPVLHKKIKCISSS